jgi:RNA polymerase sigma-70 factor (ECF subfamily)
MLGVRPDCIDDIAQETFIAAYRSLGRFEQGRSFRKWLRGVARNIVRQHRDAQEREHELRQGAAAELVRRQCERLESHTDADSPVTGLDPLRRCVARLPERLRELLDMRYAVGMTSQQIAERMKRTPEAVRMTLMRARRLLIECVQSQG